MNELYNLIRYEIRSRGYFPVIELIILFIFNLIYTSIFSSSSPGTIFIEYARVSFQKASLFTWSTSHSNTLLYLSLILIMLISFSIAGDYETGLTHSLLSMPVNRKKYLFSKLFFYICLFTGSIIITDVITWFFSPFKINLTNFILVLSFSSSVIVLWSTVAFSVAILTEKTIASIILSISLFLFTSVSSSYLLSPLVFITDPFRSLIMGKTFEGILWGFFLPFVSSIIAICISLGYFQNKDILDGDS